MENANLKLRAIDKTKFGKTSVHVSKFSELEVGDIKKSDSLIVGIIWKQCNFR